jgi:hypothetical protein
MAFDVVVFLKGGTTVKVVEASLLKAQRTAARISQAGIQELVSEPLDPEEWITHPPHQIITIDIVEQPAP